MSLDDVFGPFPGRPDHEDFRILTDIVLRQDGRSYDTDFDFREHLGQFIDPDSVTHMAEQRAGRLVRMSTGFENPKLTSMVAAAMIDAFMLGCQFQQRRTDEALRKLLADWFEGELARISEHGYSGDWPALIDDAKARHETFGVPWRDSFVPKYVRDILAMNDDD